MNILFACHRLPYPPSRGGKIRPFNIIKHFSEQGHDVSVLTLARSADELEQGQGLREHCSELIVGRIGRVGALAGMLVRLPSSVPSSMGYFYSRQLHRAAKTATARRSFDLVFVHCSSAAQYVLPALDAPSIMDFGDMDSQKWLDYRQYRPQPLASGYWLEGRKLERAEKGLARRFDVCTCTTKAEYDTLNDFGVARKLDWFPNGVDSEYFEPASGDYDKNSICFVGRMDYYPNQQAMLDFCKRIFPMIRERRPDTHLTIVGAEPSRQILGLGDLDGVEVTGTVGDVRPFVQSAAVTVAPLQIARGTQNKILESMAMGVPVVASEIAAGGVDAIPGKHLLTANEPEEYVRHIVGLLDNPAWRLQVGSAARRRVTDNHSWPASMTKLDGIVSALLSERSDGARQAGDCGAPGV